MFSWGGLAEEQPERARGLADKHSETIDGAKSKASRGFQQLGLDWRIHHVENNQLRVFQVVDDSFRKTILAGHPQ